MAASSSTATAGGGPSPTPDVLLRACKAEVQQLKDALHELALRDTSSGSPGFSNVLEAKYLAQIKKNKTLSVQLGTIQQQLAEVQKALQVEQEKTKRLVAAATSVAAKNPPRSINGGNKAGRHAGRGRQDASPTEEEDDDDDADTKPTDARSTSLQRAYDQLHQKDIALAEVQRENAALRSLVRREVGLHDDASEVDALLKNTASAAGWRGRAEEIVLLRGKLKDAQRRVEALAATGEDLQDIEGRFSINTIGSGADPLALPASVRAYLGIDDKGISKAQSSATTTTAATATRRKDVDDDARDRLAAMQQQRIAQQRQQAIDAETQQRQRQEEKLRTAALQARVTTMKAELDTLRSHVETLLDKSKTDDELMEAYKAEVQAAQAETREWRKKASAAAAATTTTAAARRTASDSTRAVGLRNGAAAAMAAAAARSAAYRKAAPSDTVEGATAASSNFDPVVYEWVWRACQESPPDGNGGTVSEVAASPSARVVAAVLRNALQHVASVERQATATSTFLDRGSNVRDDGAAHTGAAVATADDMSCAVAAAAQTEKILLTENASLKKRIRALTDLMQREMQVQEVLWSSRDAGATS
jgi:hypothetical protein